MIIVTGLLNNAAQFRDIFKLKELKTIDPHDHASQHELYYLT
jgi:hypothetical protein